MPWPLLSRAQSSIVGLSKLKQGPTHLFSLLRGLRTAVEPFSGQKDIASGNCLTYLVKSEGLFLGKLIKIFEEKLQ